MNFSGFLKSVFKKLIGGESADKSHENQPVLDFEHQCNNVFKEGSDLLNEINLQCAVFEKGSVVPKAERREVQEHIEEKLRIMHDRFIRLCDTASDVLNQSEKAGVWKNDQDKKSDARNMLLGINQVVELIDRVSIAAYDKGCTRDLIDVVDLDGIRKHDVIKRLEDMALDGMGNVFTPEKFDDPNKFQIDH